MLNALIAKLGPKMVLQRVRICIQYAANAFLVGDDADG